MNKDKESIKTLIEEIKSEVSCCCSDTRYENITELCNKVLEILSDKQTN